MLAIRVVGGATPGGATPGEKVRGWGQGGGDAGAMNAAVVLVLFVGMALVMHGIYEDKVRRLERNVRVEYRFVPRTLYEEQMASADLVGKFGSMFSRAEPWLADRTDAGGGGKAKAPAGVDAR